MARAILSFLLLSPTGYAQSVQPGIWQADTTFEISGLPLPASHAEECISASEAKDIRKTLTKELATKGCLPTKWIVKGSKIDVSLQCKDSGLDAIGKLRGSVTAKTYDLTGEAEGTYQGIPSQANLVLKGKWVRNCAK